ncbi:MAG TPA: TonB family protein [Prolixibacteraceae bacterium]|nr:TonB family protein [Prolixibacteraceae bacterium]
MNELLPYIIKSTLCLSLLYLAFRTMMRKETFFALNRILLLAIVICSILIPLINLPQIIQREMQQKLMPAFPVIENQLPEFPVVADPPTVSGPVNVMTEKPERAFPVMQLIGYLYFAGMLFSLLFLIHGLVTLLLLFRKAEIQKMEGYNLLIIEKDIPAFSFWKMIFISRADYIEHGSTILAHEQQHIRLGHFYDLLLMETAKMIHWFNPVIYWLIQDLKAIHEFQADKHTLTKGIDATKYQLLIIEKGVGHQRLALANSFNHCQIKKRITMMNQSKNGKAGLWKVATFLPLLALLLMAFGREGEKEPLSIQPQQAISNENNAQAKDTTAKAEEKIHLIVEEMPEFPGGDKALREYIAKSIQYPDAAKAKKIQGKVFVSFIVDAQGKVTNPKIVRGVDPDLDAEALRVVSALPQWSPGKQKGKPMRVSFTTPVYFVLTPDPSAKTEKVIPPPPPPPRVQNKGLLIIMDKENILVKNQSTSMEELERMITGINSKEEFVEIITNSATNKTVETEIKDLLEKQNISYRIIWNSKW